MIPKSSWNRAAQFIVVLVSALTLKHYYSTASVNQLGWILAPTTVIVEFVTGSQFEFESHAGYMSSDRSFLIAASCAGVNFLITAFLMLALGKLWRDRSQKTAWRFIPAAALFAYLATLVANTIRISTALHLQRTPLEISWLNGNQLHRLQGIFIYFGFLLLLFLVSQKIGWSTGSELCTATTPVRDGTISLNASNSAKPASLLRQSFFPLLIYYATTLGIPLTTSVYRPGPAASDFLEHAVFVVLAPLILLVPLATLQLAHRFAHRRLQSRLPRTATG